MSHFSVLVIGENFDKQLAPYHEFECTGENDQYVQDVDVTEECREHGLDWHGLDDKTVTDESQVDREDEHKFGYAIVDAEGNLIKAVNRTNPNKKWDWWSVGGRWSGLLKLKPGAHGVVGRKGLMGSCSNDGAGYCDQAKKGDVDFAGMRDEAGEKAGKKWDLFHKYLGHLTDGFVSWSEMLERHAPDYDRARNEYHAQPLRIAIGNLANRDSGLSEEERSFFVWLDAEDFLHSRETHVQAARDAAVSCFALVKDSKWYERGEMGWWACVSNEKAKDDWLREFNALLDSIPDDTTMTVVDCHI